MARRSSALVKLIDSLPDPDKRGLLSNINKQTVDDVITQIHEGGRRSLVALVNMLVEPGKGDDVKARYALHCLAVHVCKLDSEPTRSTFARTLALQLGGSRPKAVQKYIIEQLQVAGGREVLPAMGKLLLDEQLCDPAAQALTAIGDAAAGKFRQALPQAKGKCRLTIVQSLGVLRDADSASLINKFLDDEDREIRMAARWALANIGDGGSADLLLAAADDAADYERVKAAKACLLLAERLLEKGKKDTAVKIYKHLQSTRSGSDEAYICDVADEGLAAIAK